MTRHFELDKNIIHLNHAAVAPWPTQTRDAVIAFARENSLIGSQRYADWIQVEQMLKEKLRRLINADSIDEIAILKNTSEGLSLIARGLEFNAGDNIVIPKEEFPSNRVVWQALESKGVELRQVAVEGVDEPEQALIAAIDDNTRLLSCSSVQYARGLRLDLNVIGDACREADILFCVDAIQSLGALSFDVQSCNADFVVADGHKWMCGPEGTALFYCRKDRQPLLSLSQFGWHMLQDAFDFSAHSDEIIIADGAQRFESGSPNMMGIAALRASLGVLLDIGIDSIEKQVLANAGYLRERIAEDASLRLLSSTHSKHFSGIVTFEKVDVDNQALYQHLQNNNVLCAFRGGGIRFSPHFYTETEVMDKAFELVNGFTD